MDLIPGVNVRGAFKQLFTGEDQDIFSGVTNSNRPGQIQVNSLPDYGVRNTGVLGVNTGNNPNPNPTPTSNPNQNGTPAPSGVPALPALNQAAINNTQITLDQLPAILNAALAAEATRRDNTVRGFNDQEATQRQTYDQSTTTNQQNYDSNYMDSIRGGIKGMGGLLSILRGTGAAGGTAEDLVRDTVGGVTANDIRTGSDTLKTNQTNLDSVLSNVLTELKGKRQAADDTFTNNNRAIQRDNTSQMQDLLTKMAGYYSDGGRNAEATNFMNRAGSLTPSIAQNSMAKQSAYDTTPVAVQAPQLSAFQAPTTPDSTVTPNPNELGAGIFTLNRKKEQVETPVALPVGA